MGVFYHLGFGVSKNLTKAVENLTRSAKTGNGQSCYQLAILYINEEGEFFTVSLSLKSFKAFSRQISMSLLLFS